MNIVNDRPQAGPGKDSTKKVRLMHMKEIRLKSGGHSCNVADTGIPDCSAVTFRQWVYRNSVPHILLQPRSYRKKMYFIACLRQCFAGAMEYPSIIDRMTITDLADLHRTPRPRETECTIPAGGGDPMTTNSVCSLSN